MASQKKKTSQSTAARKSSPKKTAAKKSNKAKTKKKKSSRSGLGSKLFSGKGVLLALAVFFTFASLVLVLKVPPFQSPLKDSLQKRTESSSSRTSSFEETTSPTSIEQLTKEVDLVLLQTMISQGVRPQDLAHKEVVLRKDKGGRQYHYQSLIIDLPANKDAFIRVFEKNLHNLVRNCSLVRQSQREWAVKISGKPTHRIAFSTHGVPKGLPDRSPAKGNLIIVIDDLGESLVYAEKLARLDLPITFSLLPLSTRTAQVAEVARKYGKDILLHLPMEPSNLKESDPGPGALFVDMTREDMLSVLSSDLSRVPAAIGVNNHMGSAFTEHYWAMRTVLSELKKRDLFFLDSLTSPKSVIPVIADSVGVPYLRRDIFLDNVLDVELIIYQLQKAEKIALSRGFAIAIGHPYPETLKALTKWAEMKDSSVRVSSIRSLLPSWMIAENQDTFSKK
ncbi:MAG: divergent polysaccharide deacetylase family protein [Desulfovibrionales bacterium]